MKSIKKLIFLILILIPVMTFAENSNSAFELAESKEIKTLTGNKGSNGGYGAISVGYTQINDNNTIIAGLKGGWILNHNFTLGGAFYSYYNSNGYLNGSVNSGMLGGYAGLLLEPIIMAESPIHFSIPIIIGGGGATKFLSETYTYATHFIFVPGLEVEINVSKHFRMALGVDYRLTPGLTWKTIENIPIKTDDKALNGFSGHLIFKFGKF